MKYFIVLALAVAAVAGAPVEEESRKDKRGIFAAAPLLHPAPLALSAYHAPLALPAPLIAHAPLALPAPILSAPIAHAPLILPAPYSLGHGLAYGKLIH